MSSLAWRHSALSGCWRLWIGVYWTQWKHNQQPALQTAAPCHGHPCRQAKSALRLLQYVCEYCDAFEGPFSAVEVHEVTCHRAPHNAGDPKTPAQLSPSAAANRRMRFAADAEKLTKDISNSTQELRGANWRSKLQQWTREEVALEGNFQRFLAAKFAGVLTTAASTHCGILTLDIADRCTLQHSRTAADTHALHPLTHCSTHLLTAAYTNPQHTHLLQQLYALSAAPTRPQQPRLTARSRRWSKLPPWASRLADDEMIRHTMSQRFQITAMSCRWYPSVTTNE